MKSSSFTFSRRSKGKKLRHTKSAGQLQDSSSQWWREVSCPDWKYDRKMQDRLYEKPYDVPFSPKPHRRYIEYLDDDHPQLFEVCDDECICLIRWGGPNPLEIYSVNGKNIRPFLGLWNVFLHQFEPEKEKRILLHPEEMPMREFLSKLSCASKVVENSGYEVYDIKPKRLRRTKKFRV